jgi:eukaryotic-like serine/threonine-protein kinase
MVERDSSAHTITLDVHSTHHDHVDEAIEVEMDAAGAPTTTRYVVERELGRGGLSVVYAAARVDDGTRVAIKVPFSHLTDKKALRSRYVREARITGAVSHPNVIRIDDSGVLPDGRPYLVTELVDGESLDQRLRRGPLSADDALLVGVQLLGAVAALGRSGIVHRDIKPSNIMVTSDGARLTSVKLLDLGIAQRVQETAQELPMAPGPAAGTPMYMAPEQLNGLSVDSRTDVYACGAVLYECMFGVRDDGHRNVRDARWRRALSFLRRGDEGPRHRYPRALLSAVNTALSPQRRRRYPSAEAMEQALLRARRSHQRPLSQRVLGASLAASAALSVLGGAAYLALGKRPGLDGALPRSAATEQVAVVDARDRGAAVATPAQQPSAPSAKPPTALAPAEAEPSTPGSDEAAPRDPKSQAAKAIGRRLARARAALEAESPREARQHARSALSVDRYEPEALRIVIRASVALGDTQAAREALATYGSAHPSAGDLAALRALVP